MNHPEHWLQVPLNSIAEVRLGRQRSPARANGPDMRPYVRAANVTWGGLKLDDVKEMDFSAQEREVFRLKRGDLLLSEASGSASEVGKPALWKEEIPECYFQNTLLRVRAAEDLVPFLHLHFAKDALTGAFADASKGVGIHHLSAATLSAWAITFPPLGEQRSIVEALDSYFTRLDAAEAALLRAQANLKRYRASVLKAAVEGRLVPTEAELARREGREYEPASELLRKILVEKRLRWEKEERAKMAARGVVPKDDRWKAKYQEPAGPDTSGLPELPEGWCWATVGQLAEVPLANGRSVPTAPLGKGFPVLRLTALADRRVNLKAQKIGAWTEREAAPFLVKDGDFLISRGNGSKHLVGRGALVAGQPGPVAFPDTMIRLRIDRDNLHPEFLSFLWNSVLLRRHIEMRAKTTAGIYKVNQRDLEEMPVPIAPMVEQSRVSSYLMLFESQAEALDSVVPQNLARIARLRQSILKWAFEGRLVDQDPNDEPAAELLARIRAERESVGGVKRGRVRRKGA